MDRGRRDQSSVIVSGIVIDANGRPIPNEPVDLSVSFDGREMVRSIANTDGEGKFENTIRYAAPADGNPVTLIASVCQNKNKVIGKIFGGKFEKDDNEPDISDIFQKALESRSGTMYQADENMLKELFAKLAEYRNDPDLQSNKGQSMTFQIGSHDDEISGIRFVIDASSFITLMAGNVDINEIAMQIFINGKAGYYKTHTAKFSSNQVTLAVPANEELSVTCVVTGYKQVMEDIARLDLGQVKIINVNFEKDADNSARWSRDNVKKLDVKDLKSARIGDVDSDREERK